MGKPSPLISWSFAAVLTVVSGCEDDPPSAEGSSTGSSDASGGPSAGTTTGGAMSTGSSGSPSSTSDGSSSSGTPETGSSSTGEPTSIDLENLQDWTRVEGRVLYDVVEGYPSAADAHVFRDDSGELTAIYSGADPNEPEYSAIKFARGSEPAVWELGGALLNGTDAPVGQLHKETSFYRRASDGTHQIYYIAYDDEETYRSQIFRAESAELEGPYTVQLEPSIARGLQGENDIQVMTSPSIVESDGTLYMFYCAWSHFEGNDDLQVWVHGATSDDDGDTWTVLGEVDVPVCMEGSLTEGPDGMFYAVAQSEGGITLGRAGEPLGPYEMLPEPVLTPAGPPYEIDELIAPQLYFEDDVLFLYYSGANYSDTDHELGWWTLLAYTSIE